MIEDSYIMISAHRMIKDLDHETAQISAAHGLTFSQFIVLEALLNKDRMTVGEIKDTILSSNGTIPVIINNLVKLGMVQRIKDHSDQRKSVVELTDQGRKLIEQVRPENDRMFAEKFAVWTRQEKMELKRLLSLYPAGQNTKKSSN